MNKIKEYSGLSDAELVTYLRDGDDIAFTEIYNRYKGILHVHAYKKLGDFEEAKDVIQEMFSWLWNNRATLNDISNVSGYLYGIVKNMVLNTIAHKKVVNKYVESFNNFIDKGVFITDVLVREKELSRIIESEINSLPRKMKAVFILSRKQNLSVKEMAQELNISENTVKYHMKSALKVLRTKLGLLIYLLVFIK